MGTQGTLNSGDADDYQVSRPPPLLCIASNTSAESDRSLTRRHSSTCRRKTNCIVDFSVVPSVTYFNCVFAVLTHCLSVSRADYALNLLRERRDL